MSYKIGVDGGGTKTECILVDDAGIVLEVVSAVGCNPSVVGTESAKSILMTALNSLRARATVHFQRLARTTAGAAAEISTTLLCMAGSRTFWSEFAASLQGFGRVFSTDDSVPTLELATHGQPGIVLHSGTGSFVAARTADLAVHYAGGLGWRLGDPGSGYDLGRAAIARALLELQGWKPAPEISALVCEHLQFFDAASLKRAIYQDASPNQKIAALAPGVLRLASEGDEAAQEIITRSMLGLLELATTVIQKLFPGVKPELLRAGVSGPILNHPMVAPVLRAHSSLPLLKVEGLPIEGVRRLLVGNAF